MVLKVRVDEERTRTEGVQGIPGCCRVQILDLHAGHKDPCNVCENPHRTCVHFSLLCFNRTFFFFFFWLPRGIWSSWARVQIQAAVATKATAVATFGSLTHCAGPGIKPVSQHSQDDANSVTPQWEHQSFFFFRATLVAYGSSQARDQIGAIAAGLRHSHSNVGSEPCL